MRLREKTGISLAGSAVLASSSHASVDPQEKAVPFRYCLNMSTIRGQKPTVEDEIDIAGKAGYDAIEPWVRKIHEYVKGGGELKDLRRRIDDNGLTVESAIGFARWIVDDDTKRAQGFEEAKRDMDTLAQLGGIRIAAPPAGAPRDRAIDPMKAAARYRQLLELGDEMGVVPQIEMWGGNKSIGRVSTAIFIAIECGHPKACFLGDVYHTYKGGSDFDGLRLLGPRAIQHFHMNEYPADPPRATIPKPCHSPSPPTRVRPPTSLVSGRWAELCSFLMISDPCWS